MAAAGFLAVKRVACHQFADIEEVHETERFLQFLVELLVRARHTDRLPKFFPEVADFLNSLLQAGLVASHTHIFPHDVAEFLVDAVHGFGSLDREDFINPVADGLFRLSEFRSIRVSLRLRKLMGQIVADGVGKNEVTIGQALHQGGSTETVSTMVGEVGFTDGIETRNGRLEIIVNPETAHGIVDGRIDHHRLLPRRRGSNLLIHLEEVSIALLNPLMTETLDSIGKIKEHSQTCFIHAESGVATFLRSTGSDVTGNQITESRITAFEIIVATILRNLGSLDFVLAEFHHIFQILRNPDAAVVTERLRHQRKFALLVTMHRNTGRMDLRKAGVGKESTLAISLHRRRTVGIHCVRGKEIGISITTGSKNYCVRTKAFDIAGYEVTRDDTLRLTVDNDEVKHFVTRITLHGSCCNFLIQRRIGTEQQLLAGLAAGIESTAHLHTAEGTVGQISAVFAGERNTLGDALVDDRGAHLGQTIHIGLAGTVVTALDRIVKQPVDGVVVVLVVLRGVDTALGGDGVRAARRVGDAEDLDVVSQLAQRGGCGRTTQTRTHDDHLEFPLVVRRYNPDFSLALRPFLGEGSFRNLGNKFGVSHIDCEL